MLRAITCAVTMFLATAFVTAQDVRSTVGPLEQSATPSSPENPIPRRTSAAQARQLDDWRRVPGGRGGVQFQVTLDTSGRIGEIRRLGDPFVFTAGASVDETTRRGIADAMIKSAADALRRWTYDPPAAPIKFTALFTFGAAMEPSAVQRDEAPARSRGPAPAPASGSVTPPPRQIEDWPAAAGIPRIGRGVQPPKQTKKVNPAYPLAAQLERVQGMVVLEAIIDVDGKVRDVRVLRSAPFLDQAAVDAVRQWEYEPAQRDGKPTPVVMTMTTTFRIDGGREYGPLIVPPWPAAEGAVRVGGEIAVPRQTRTVRPDFPDEARRARTGGAVLLEALIGPDGKVTDVRVIRSSPLFDKEAVDAVRKSEWEPTRINGVAVPIVLTVTVPFSFVQPRR